MMLICFIRACWLLCICISLGYIALSYLLKKQLPVSAAYAVRQAAEFERY